MKTKTTSLITLALIATSICAFSQGPTGPPPPPPDIIAVHLDKDHDHELTAREIRNAAKALLKLDKDKDGAISKEELRPEPPEGGRRKKKEEVAEEEEVGEEGEKKAPKPQRSPSEFLKAIDTNEDGALSIEELEGAPVSLLKLDLDADGKIDNEEAPALGDPASNFGPPGGGRPPGPPPGGGGR